MPDAISVSSGLHRYAIAACLCCLAAMLIGAMVTSSGGTEFVELHHMTAGIAALVIVILGVWMAAKGPAKLGWAILAMAVVEVAIGLVQDPGAVILHALMAQLLFASTAAAVVCTSSGWLREPDLVEDHGWPSLGSLGKITPVLVFLQIAMGAAFRHKEMGVLPHLLGAMILVLVILCLCIFVTQQFPTHQTLRPSSNFLMVIAFTQIFLGIAAFTVRTMTIKTPGVVVGITAAHACVGSMTLASAVVLSMQIRRNVFKKDSSE